jgi:glucokinase
MEPVRGPANDQFMRGSDDPHDYPRLLADIGGTNVRFTLEIAPGSLHALSELKQVSFRSLSDALRAYLSQPKAIAAGAKQVRHAAFAIANPLDDDWVQMTNSSWAFSIESLRLAFGFDTLQLINDFTALAMAIPGLTSDQKLQVGDGTPMAGRAIGLLGPGTGLGVSGLVPHGGDWVALESEGGHVSFSPANECEAEILRFAWREFPHVSAERLISGMGLELIYRTLLTMSGAKQEILTAADITQRALAGECPTCDEAVELFCTMLGTVAGNLALTLGAKGGIYLGGGIVPRLGDRFVNSGFRQRFEQKGRFSKYLAEIPTYIITAKNPALFGVSRLLERHLIGR